MARGRMINKKISTSRRVDELPLEAALLYTWLITHVDRNGCFYGSAAMVKSQVVPRKDYSTDDVEKWLKLMEKSLDENGTPLIMRYKAKGDTYLILPGFWGEQTAMRFEKEHDEHPFPLNGNILTAIRRNIVNIVDGKMAAYIRLRCALREEKGIEEKGIEEKGKNKKQKTNIFGIFNDNFQILTSETTEFLKDLEKEFGGESVLAALKIAIKRNKRNLSYVEGILKKGQIEKAEGWSSD